MGSNIYHINNNNHDNDNGPDWEFLEGSKIWTGKGEQEHSNQTYLQIKQELKALLCGNDESTAAGRVSMIDV